MDETQILQLNRFYDLKEEALQLEHDAEDLNRRWNEVRGKQILCREKLMNYESFSVGSLIDRLKGSYQQRLEDHRRELRHADAEQTALRHELKMLEHKQKKNQEAVDALPDEQTIRSWVQTDPNGQQEFFRREAGLCLTALPPLLEKNHSTLIQLHGYLRGERAGEILSVEEQQKILGAPDRWGEACKTWLLRLKAALDGLNIPFEIPDYYRNPITYILSAAARHNRIDRAAKALDQVAGIKKQIASITQTAYEK